MDHKDMIIGGRVIEPGNALNFETGDWRSYAPVVDMSLCIDCMTCWIYCPDDCILVKDNKMAGIRLTHCKGCGICAKMCPKKAITMTEE
jgi:pyruvate ferredoxin oxidoreductase delta subunit